MDVTSPHWTQRRYDTVDLYSGVNSNELLRLAFQTRDQIAASLHTCTVVARV